MLMTTLVLSNWLWSSSGILNPPSHYNVRLLSQTSAWRVSTTWLLQPAPLARHVISWSGALQTLPTRLVFQPRQSQVLQFCGLAFFVCDVVSKPQKCLVFPPHGSWKAWTSSSAVRCTWAGGRRSPRASTPPTSRDESITPSTCSERTLTTREWPVPVRPLGVQR